MKKLILAALVAVLVLCAASCALADTAKVAEAKTGVTKINSTEWADKFPDVYATYMATEENKEVIDHVAEYPMIATVYEGMAFNTYYGSARGHFYAVEDVQATGRPHKLANCWTCKTADFTHMANEMGVEAYSIPFEDALQNINESMGCYTCHANTPGEGNTVTHLYLAQAMGDDMAKVPAQTAVCAQCHVEYYFAPADKSTTLPYTGLAVMNPDDMYAYYEAIDFSDYTNPRTGVRQLKTQHPEFETYMGVGSVHAGMFTCADCHMERVTKEDGTVYRSHLLVSPLQSESIMATCAACHADLPGFVHSIQEKMEERTIAIGYKLEELTNRLADAVASGQFGEEELDAVREMNRKAQWYWDFVFVENSEGAHNSKLDNSCLDKAEALIDEALRLLAR
jgi:nitrite reductase (cytochrome c-552)